MEKDATAAHRRHRPGPGAPPSGAKASEAAELQRSRSVGGLLQKGDPPSCIKKLYRESESEDQGKDLKCDPEEVTSHADLKEHKWEESQHILGKADRESGTAEPEVEENSSGAGGRGSRNRTPSPHSWRTFWKRRWPRVPREKRSGPRWTWGICQKTRPGPAGCAVSPTPQGRR
ncbi:uncharacterized protein C13orf46 homolog isoform X3 [Equus asinus]|uniref:uncharacterized protein C13orf46 homolog isoform X3 n=1 Tax=Equus asinus TaxID=9793 RepID=UPI0038F5DA14